MAQAFKRLSEQPSITAKQSEHVGNAGAVFTFLLLLLMHVIFPLSFNDISVRGVIPCYNYYLKHLCHDFLISFYICFMYNSINIHNINLFKKMHIFYSKSNQKSNC